jgi:RimJ/RimL family protein N-acetyltransferase
MFDQKTNQLIGSTGYHHFDWTIPSLETGYWIRTAWSGQGLMTETVNALTQYAFKQLSVERITITCDINNIQSKKIPEALGYSLEGVLKSHRRKSITGELSDTLIYARYHLEGLPDLKVSWPFDVAK